ncbi:response regulator [Achromobacter mucicolens]|jgi:CheY-like chemotaxis protein|uniref:response regulator n=1 Tax=Achromobacter mucicolens TaxID=1389922 RepID=UPI00242F9B5D|nr:response regulator [Achromobacter mucicolens]
MRVLIVDDDSTTAELTAECLMLDPDVSARTAGDGATALRALTEFDPDVILLDLELPDESGLDLAPRFKGMNPGRAPRIILFTGSAQGDAPFLPDGIDAWLTKPVNLDTLLDCICRPTGGGRML